LSVCYEVALKVGARPSVVLHGKKEVIKTRSKFADCTARRNS